MQNFKPIVLQESEFDTTKTFPTIFLDLPVYMNYKTRYCRQNISRLFFMFKVPKIRLDKYDPGSIYPEKAIQTFLLKIFCHNKDIIFGKFRGGEKFLCFLEKLKMVHYYISVQREIILKTKYKLREIFKGFREKTAF